MAGDVQTYRSRIPYGPHVLALFIMSFTVLILLILVTFSAPFVPTIHFLTAAGVTFGAFGYCTPTGCQQARLGYEYGNEVLSALTSAMILWGITCVFCLFTLFSVIPLLWVHDSQALHSVANGSFFKTSLTLSTIVSVVTWNITIVGWCEARRHFQISSLVVQTLPPKLGPAIWMSLVATLLLLIIQLIGWPADALGGANNSGYYHYRQTTREVTRPRSVQVV